MSHDCCSHKTKHRSEEEYKALLNRLSRIEGQIRGIRGMIERNAYCPDILMQVSAVNSALNSFNRVLTPLTQTGAIGAVVLAAGTITRRRPKAQTVRHNIFTLVPSRYRAYRPSLPLPCRVISHGGNIRSPKRA